MTILVLRTGFHCNEAEFDLQPIPNVVPERKIPFPDGNQLRLVQHMACHCSPADELLLVLLLVLLLLLLLLLLLIKRYNLYKVLACSTTFFQLSLFCPTFFQLRLFVLFISSKTSSSQRVLGLPVGPADELSGCIS